MFLFSKSLHLISHVSGTAAAANINNVVEVVTFVVREAEVESIQSFSVSNCIIAQSCQFDTTRFHLTRSKHDRLQVRDEPSVSQDIAVCSTVHQDDLIA